MPTSFIEIIQALLILFSVIIFLFFFWAGLISNNENETRAAKRFFMISFLLPVPYLLLYFVNFPFQNPISFIVVIVSVITPLILLLAVGNNKSYQQPLPKSRIDERDTMFSRNELIPGTKEFDDYYTRNPQNREADDLFRSKAGLLKPGSSQYNPLQFASADASFETIEALKNKVDGPIEQKQILIDEIQITNYIKRWSEKLGALDCGIIELKDYHLYTVGGRKERRDKTIVNLHKFAIAFTVEMDKSMVDSAPAGSIVMESAQQYLESGKIAIQLAAFIRNLGHEARAHIDGNYQVICPLVARDAGLGEIGRMGLLMTPNLGPRVRIAVVTTNLPLQIDPPRHDYSMIDFCEKCKKCADACPSQAISFDKRKEIDGAKRWQINQEACFTLWCQFGTDCGRCVSVCPYSHPDNSLHNFVRFGLKKSGLFRTAALKMDDYFYGRKPPSKAVPEWMNINKLS